MVFTKTTLHVLTSTKKGKEFREREATGRDFLSLSSTSALSSSFLNLPSPPLHFFTVTMLEPLAPAAKAAAGVDLAFHARAKGSDGSSEIGALLAAAKGAGPALGGLPKDTPVGALGEAWTAALAASGLDPVDISGGLGKVLGVKEAPELAAARAAARVAAAAVVRYFSPELERLLDEGKAAKHSKLAGRLERALADPAGLGITDIPADGVEAAYPPTVQSGGRCEPRLAAPSDGEALAQAGPILVGVGARVGSYCANLARTFVVNGGPGMEAEYRALAAAHAAAVGALVEGAPLSAARAAAAASLAASPAPHLAARLPKTVGAGMGLELRESGPLSLSASNDTPAAAGMVLHVSIGLAGLEAPPPKNEDGRDEAAKKATPYALWLADTVIVTPGGSSPPEVLTADVTAAWGDVAYELDGSEEEGEEAEEGEDDEDGDDDGDGGQREARTTRGAAAAAADDGAPAPPARRGRGGDDALLRRINEETLRLLTRGGAGGSGGGAGGTARKVSDAVAYASPAEVPAPRELAITVDPRHEAVLLPIYGAMVPFHVLALKAATSAVEGGHAYVRLAFHAGGAYEPAARFPTAVMLKEVAFRSSDPKHAARVVQEVKALRASVLARDKESAERATLVAQERLVKAKARPHALPDVWIRPPFGGKGRKMAGALEAHANGFRYSSPRGDTLDILYRNIKHAFFQPAEAEMITLVHFNLIHPIMVGKKKTVDVQFYTEVMDVVQTLDAGRRAAYDPDEIEEEQRERELRARINKTYQAFVKRVQGEVWADGTEYAALNLEFEVPYRELGFFGVPHRSTVFVMPTVNCLVELTEQPFTVLTLADVIVVNLERVGFNLRNFDMTLVFKDLTRDVVRIDAIPIKALETVREWLASVDIKCYESKINLNWKPILKNIRDDPTGFVEAGGWDFLDVEGGSSEEDGGGSDEEDEEFAPSSAEEEESSEEESSEEEDEDDADDSDASGGSGGDGSDDDSDAMSWDEMEKAAAREDRAKAAAESDSEDERRKKRRAGGGGGGGGGKKVRR